ncbi:antibiotic biosynthesis monooxygenase family protein [Novosphingopyxis sp.]|uniref:antibiotic biosynthesis monooxygenase family protein n=1 Tax=Novosphingopyxis sp. TaxID=2709690 RepID=UPI003B596CF0
MSYSVIWEYFVPEDKRTAFEQAYGGEGPWVDLFDEAEGFLGTWLLRDKEQQGRYLSHDRWTNRAAYDAFKRGFAERYEALDRELDGLSTRENYIGAYDEVTG